MNIELGNKLNEAETAAELGCDPGEDCPYRDCGGIGAYTCYQLNGRGINALAGAIDLLRLRRSLDSGQLQHTGAQHKVKLKLEDGSLYPALGADGEAVQDRLLPHRL